MGGGEATWCRAGVLLLGFTGSAARREGRSRSDARRAAELAPKHIGIEVSLVGLNCLERGL